MNASAPVGLCKVCVMLYEHGPALRLMQSCTVPMGTLGNIYAVGIHTKWDFPRTKRAFGFISPLRAFSSSDDNEHYEHM